MCFFDFSGEYLKKIYLKHFSSSELLKGFVYVLDWILWTAELKEEEWAIKF